MRLILIRHGQTSSNVAGLLDTGDPGAGLTDLGLTQAQSLVDVLSEEPLIGLYSSHLLRAQHTALPLAQARGLPVQHRPGLREIRAGELEMSGQAEDHQVFGRTVQAWAEGRRELRMPGAESGHEVLQRFDTALEEITEVARRGPVAVVSHGAMLRYWLASRSVNYGPDHLREHLLENTGRVVLEGAPGDWHVVSWQDAPLPAIDRSPGASAGAPA